MSVPVADHPWRGKKSRSFPDVSWVDEADPLEEELWDQRVIERYLQRLGVSLQEQEEE